MSIETEEQSLSINDTKSTSLKSSKIKPSISTSISTSIAITTNNDESISQNNTKNPKESASASVPTPTDNEVKQNGSSEPKLNGHTKHEANGNNNDRSKKDNNQKPSKWAKQKAKRKRRKKRKKERKRAIAAQQEKVKQVHNLLNKPKEIEIDYVSETLTDTAKTNFAAAFERFTPAEDLFKTKEQLLKEAEDKEKLKKKKEKEEREKLRKEDPIDAAIPDDKKNVKSQSKNGMDEDDDDEMDGEDNENKKPLSNKMRKQLNRPSIAALKKSVERSDLVEEHDVNAPDPFLLIELKSMRNTVPVPNHWLQKRKYLQGKRGFLKPAFKLPPYIQATGITKMRENRLNLLSEKSMKQKQRERMRPKKGGLEISYKILHEAFFTHQTKPDDLTGFGDLYYEGKEFMMKFRKFKPGYISDNLKKALGMTPRYRVVSPSGVMVKNKKEDEETGDISWYDVQELKYGQYVVCDEHYGPKRIKISAPVTGFVWLSSKDGKEEKLKRCDVEDPPPWLINMQRFGPPPSYPDLKIPGLNAPIPTHKMYGFHEGQWGKPPVDENGQPLYGDPFGIWTEPISKSWGGKSRWGVLEKFEESSDDDEDDSDDDDDDSEENQDDDIKRNMTTDDDDVDMVQDEIQRQKDLSGIESDMSGISSVPSQINLRKNTVINNLTGIETPTSGISTQDIRMRNEEDKNKELYQVLKPMENAVHKGTRFGSSTVYQMPDGSNGSNRNGTKRKNNDNDESNDKKPPTKKRRQ